jgi:hypothetical protein
MIRRLIEDAYGKMKAGVTPLQDLLGLFANQNPNATMGYLEGMVRDKQAGPSGGRVVHSEHVPRQPDVEEERKGRKKAG